MQMNINPALMAAPMQERERRVKLNLPPEEMYFCLSYPTFVDMLRALHGPQVEFPPKSIYGHIQQSAMNQLMGLRVMPHFSVARGWWQLIYSATGELISTGKVFDE